MKQIVPLEKNILIKILEQANETDSGIQIPDGVDVLDTQRVEVVALGDKYKGYLEEGDEAYISQYGGMKIKKDGEEFQIVGKDAILAVLKEK